MILRQIPGLRSIFLVAALVQLAGCAQLHELQSTPPVSPIQSFSPTRTPFQPLSSTGTVQATVDNAAEPTSSPGVAASYFDVWAPPYLPAHLHNNLLQAGISTAGEPGQAAASIQVGMGASMGYWVYALVVPFASSEVGVSLENIKSAWKGDNQAGLGGKPLLLDESTLGMFTSVWGAPEMSAVQVLPTNDLLDYAWRHRPSWALLPFENLEPRWKVIEIDGLSPVRKEFDPAAYPLSIPLTVAGSSDFSHAELLNNRDASRLTTVALTGVTALVRATAYTMEQRGVRYPGKDVVDWLRGADITHISNEVPFARNCPFPNPVQQGVRFCSDVRYIDLLEFVGTDIVELTGDHFQDYGTEAMLYTLDLYRERGWLYYGGGENLQDGRKAAIIEHNGNRLAFIGCNGKGGSFAQAAPQRPGAVTCDMSWMVDEIARLRAEGYLPIVTFQHFEYYTYQAQPNQKQDFRRVAEAGAVIVSGSQAHQPQAMEFSGQSFIHYGLGNLFFDQYDISLACRQAFIDRHVFYDSHYISTELLPILFVDYARARPMTSTERTILFDSVFSASGW